MELLGEKINMWIFSRKFYRYFYKDFSIFDAQKLRRQYIIVLLLRKNKTVNQAYIGRNQWNSDDKNNAEYTITISAPGFESVEVNGAEIFSGETAIQDAINALSKNLPILPEEESSNP